LFNGCAQKIGQKLGEEAVELAIAAQYSDAQRCTEEGADLYIIRWSLLASKDITIQQVETELEMRMASGRE